MTSRFSLALLSSLLVLTGAGCFGGSEDTSSVGGLWFSATGGDNWESHNTLLSSAGNGDISSVDVTVLTADPQDGRAVYAGTLAKGLFTSLDGGVSWSRPSEELLRSGRIVDVEVDAKNVCTYYVLLPTRLLKTTTCGRTWDLERYVETQPKVELTALAVDWFNPSIVYLGNTEGTIVKSTDAGATWTTVNRLRKAVSDLSISRLDSRIVLAGSVSDAVARSTDSGVTWTSLEDALSDFRKADRVFDFAQSADGKTWLMSSEFGLLKSTDAGATWSAIPLVPGAGDIFLSSVAVAPNNGQVIYYGTPSSVAKSTNGGQSWTFVNNPSDRAASALLVSDVEADDLLVGLLKLD